MEWSGVDDVGCVYCGTDFLLSSNLLCVQGTWGCHDEDEDHQSFVYINAKNFSIEYEVLVRYESTMRGDTHFSCTF